MFSRDIFFAPSQLFFFAPFHLFRMSRQQSFNMMLAAAGGALTSAYVWFVLQSHFCEWKCWLLHAVCLFVRERERESESQRWGGQINVNNAYVNSLSLPSSLCRLPSFERAKHLQPLLEERQKRIDELKNARARGYITANEFDAEYKRLYKTLKVFKPTHEHNTSTYH